ncbi:MAG: KGG domain-containing protein [Polyangiaceae bacterium]
MNSEFLEPASASASTKETTTETETETKEAAPKSRRGFAVMNLEKRREIASKGGRAAHAQGKAHHFDANEAREAGRKGGSSVSRDREHMAAIGRAGGLARGRRVRAKAQAASKSSDAPEESGAPNP